MALFGKKSDASTGSAATATTKAPPKAKGSGANAKGGVFGKGKKGADTAPATAPDAATSGLDAGMGFDDFSDFGAPSPEVSRAPVVSTRARPKVLGGTAIGLNIGSSAIKVVELRASGGNIKITGAATVSTPLESLSNGVIISQAALANAIRGAVQAAGIKSKAVTTAVSGTGSIVVRVVELPRMSDKELEETMRTDAEKFIPFAPEEVRLDFRALRELPSPPDSPNMDVLIAAAQREVLYQYGDAIKAAKLSPRAIEVEPLAVTRALSHAVEGAEVNYGRVTAAINIGSSATEISVLRGDILVFTRTLPSGGNALTQALVDYLGLSEGEAERVKQEFADALPPFQTAGAMGAPAADGFDAGDDWSNLDFDTPTTTGGGAGGATVAASTSATVSANPAGTVDPFDEDFLRQAGIVTLQKDAPEQHGQKDDEKSDETDKASFDFSSFDFGNMGDETTGPATPPVSATPMSPVPASATPASATPAEDFGFDFDALDETEPTTVVTPDDPHEALGGVSSTVISFAKTGDAAPQAPQTTAQATPDFASSALDATPPAASTPDVSAFNFSFDSPAEPDAAPASPLASAAPAAVDPVLAPPVSSFDFDFPSGTDTTVAAPGSGAAMAPLTPMTSAQPTVDLGKSELPAASDPSMTVVPADDLSAWGLDDITSATGASGTAAGGVTTDEAPFASTAASTSPGAVGGDDTFDMDALFATPSGTDAVPAVAGGAGLASAAGTFDPASGGDDPFGTAQDFNDFGVGLTNDIAPGVDAPTVYSILHPLLDELAGEIRRSLEYHASRYPEAVVQSIELVGGGAKLRNLDAFLTQSLGIPASVGDPLRNIGGDLSPNVRADSPSYAVAVGLALRELLA